MQNEEYCIPILMSNSFVQSQEAQCKMIVGLEVGRNPVERGLLLLGEIYYSPFGAFPGVETDPVTVDCITLIPIFLLDIGSEGRYISRA